MTVNHTHSFSLKKIDTDSDNTFAVEIYDENEYTGQDWRGYNQHWDQLLSKIKLRKTNIDFRQDKYFQNFHQCEYRGKYSQFRWSTGQSILHLEEYGGCKCRLSFSCPVPIDVDFLNVYGETIHHLAFSGAASFEFVITHQTRWLKIESNTWQPKKVFKTNDRRLLGICLEKIEMERLQQQ